MNKKSIIFKRASITHISEIIKLRRFMFESMGTTDKGKLNRMVEASRMFMEEEIPKNVYIGWIAKNHSEEIIGTLGLVIDKHPPTPENLSGKIGYIMNLAVYPSFQNQGIATKLLKICFEWLKEQDIRLVSLHASEEGKSLYMNLGFKDSNEMRLKLT
ncbi:GNAT family N-acetyltransferase [Candidatus Hodarchaeum mangrovi]